MNNTLGQVVRCSPLASEHQSSMRFATPAPRDFTESSSSDYASSMLDDRHILVEKIDSLKLQLAETQRRQEYLRGINHNLRQALSKLQENVREQSNLQPCEGTFLRSATFQDSLASVHNLPTQQSSELDHIREYYEHRIKESQEKHDTQKQQLEQRYLTRIEQIRQEIDAQAKTYIARQLELMQGEIRVHFQKERSKAEAYLRSLLPEKRIRVSSPSYFLPSPINNSGRRPSQSRLLPQLHTSCVETVQPQINSHRSQTRQRDSLPSKKVDISVSTRNVATDLFCENCRQTFTPTEFFPHAKNCQKKQESQISSIQESRWQLPVQMRPESSFSDLPKPADTSQPESSQRVSQPIDLDFDLLQALLKKKEQIEFKIENLKYSKNSENRREREILQTDLDQLILVIQKKRKYKDPDSSSKKQPARRGGKSFCSSIFKDNKHLSRIYLEDRPLMKKSLNCRKQNSSNTQNHPEPISLTTSVKYSAPATPTTSKRFLKRF